MDHASTSGITRLLGDLSGGDEDAFGKLIEIVYDDLHRVAQDRLRKRFGERLDAMTISPTSLTNDAAIAIMKQRSEWKNSDHFFAIATRLMLRLITDYQRERLALKRGGGKRGRPIESIDVRTPHDADDLLDGESLRAIDAVSDLHEIHPRKAEVVTLHVFTGHPLPRVASMLGVSVPTVERDWRFAKAWLAKELRDHD